MSKITRNKTRKPIVFTRKKRSSNDVEEATYQLRCAKCGTVFSNVYSHCPECNSKEWTGYDEINPYTRMPLESFLQLCGHVFWLGGTFLCIFLLWQTTSDVERTNTMYVVAGIGSLFLGLLISAGYFAMSEIILRILRVQRRLRAFHNTFSESGSSEEGVNKKSIKLHRSPL